MTIDLLIAPPAAGKTRACIKHIREVKKDNPLAQVWVLVPNPQAAAQFKARLAESGGSMGVRVGLFAHLFRKILEEKGVFIPVLSQSLSHRLIQETVREASIAGELVHYDAIQDKPGFLSVLKDAFAELRGARVKPGAFLDYTRNSSPARYELAILYNRFLKRLPEIGWVDGEGLSWLAIEALEADPTLASRLNLVVVDGFTAFTAAQRQFLKQLGEQTDEMLITLPGERDSERTVDRRSREVLKALQRDGLDVVSDSLTPLPPSKEGVEKGLPPLLPAAGREQSKEGVEMGDGVIRYLAQHIFETSEIAPAETESPPLHLSEPIMLEARSQAEEAREALRWIKRLHVRQGVLLSACAVFCADLNTYQPLLRAAADEFGLNIHFSQRDPLSESPAILSILNLLSLPLEGYPTRTLLNALHSPYFDFGLEETDLENLEKVAQEAVIVNGREQWDDAWIMLERKPQTVEEPDDDRGGNNPSTGIDLQALKAGLDAFWDHFDQLSPARSQAGWIEWFEALLGELGFYENITTERDRAACKSLGEALRALVVSEQVVGVREVDYAQFLVDLQGALNGAGLEDDRETRKDALFASKLVEARAARYQAVVLLGLSEGLFPVVENPDPFLDEQLRADLRLEPRLEREQTSTFYQAFTRADSHLLLTRPYLSDDGEEWEPSPYWRATMQLFSKTAVAKIQKTDDRPQSEAASSQELLFWAIQQGKLVYAKDETLAAREQYLDIAHGILDARRSKYAHGRYEGDLSRIADVLAQQFPTDHVWSASRLEAYCDCPYRFFTGATLGLEKAELPEPGLDIRQIGTLYHRILELVYTEAAANKTSPLDILDKVAQRVFRTAPEDLGFRPTALWEVEKHQFLETLRQSLQAMEEARGEWQPFAFEQKFGFKGTPKLELELDGEVVHLHGVIDRVDKNAEGEIRVVDYKTGGSMGNNDLIEGTRLQLPIYAAAAQATLNLGEVVDGFYWAINAAKPSSLTLTKFKSDQGNGIDAAHNIVLNHIFSSVSNVRRGNFQPETPKNGCVDYCPASLWCWRYRAKGTYD